MSNMLHTSIEGNVLKTINSLTFFKASTDLNDIESKLKFLPGTDMLPSKLRLLHWDAYPMTSLPPGYSPHCLVELILRHSKLERLWDGTLVSYHNTLVLSLIRNYSVSRYQTSFVYFFFLTYRS